MQRIYLDYNATTPTAASVQAAVRSWSEGRPANASSIHDEGRRARTAVEKARVAVAELVGTDDPAEIVFTSSATEANHTAVIGAGLARPERRRVVVSAIEHPCTLGAAEFLSRLGYSVVVSPCDADGRIDVAHLASLVDEHTAVVSAMAANNETGVMQPVEAIGELARRHGAWFHVDAAQCPGRIPVHVGRWGADLLTVSGHKMYAGLGAAALRVRRGLDLVPLLSGHQERGRRGGTENTPAIVALGAAATLARERLEGGEPQRLTGLRDRLWTELSARVADSVRLGGGAEILPNTLSVRFPGVDGQAFLMALDLDGIAASTGSACTSGTTEPSHVLLAMGLSASAATEVLRFSLGAPTTEACVVDAAGRIADALTRARSALDSSWSDSDYLASLEEAYE